MEEFKRFLSVIKVQNVFYICKIQKQEEYYGLSNDL